MALKPFTAANVGANYRSQQARAAAILTAAGAFDAAPTALYCPDMDFVTLYITYTRGGAAGALTFKIEVSPRTVDSLTLQNWYQAAILAGGAVAAGVDTTSLTQREETEYTALTANAEMYVYGPVELRSTVERIRVVCAESGNVGAPGTAQITAVFS